MVESMVDSTDMGMVWYGMVWYGMVWYGYGMVESMVDSTDMGPQGGGYQCMALSTHTSNMIIMISFHPIYFKPIYCMIGTAEVRRYSWSVNQ